jgi:hypothetical protein
MASCTPDAMLTSPRMIFRHTEKQRSSSPRIRRPCQHEWQDLKANEPSQPNGEPIRNSVIVVTHRLIHQIPIQDKCEKQNKSP